MTIPYDTSIEQEMKKFYGTLSEKDKRHYAAIEALKLGYGGIISSCKTPFSLLRIMVSRKC